MLERRPKAVEAKPAPLCPASKICRDLILLRDFDAISEKMDEVPLEYLRMVRKMLTSQLRNLRHNGFRYSWCPSEIKKGDFYD